MSNRKRLPKRENETKLERVVRYWLNNQGASYEDGWRGAYRDLEHGGCQSGIVSTLVYYEDTVKFYGKHREEIAELLKEFMGTLGTDGPADLFGNKWDTSDPLAHAVQNQNLLAWFAFEETARKIAEENEFETTVL